MALNDVIATLKESRKHCGDCQSMRVAIDDALSIIDESGGFYMDDLIDEHNESVRVYKSLKGKNDAAAHEEMMYALTLRGIIYEIKRECGIEHHANIASLC